MVVIKHCTICKEPYERYRDYNGNAFGKKCECGHKYDAPMPLPPAPIIKQIK